LRATRDCQQFREIVFAKSTLAVWHKPRGLITAAKNLFEKNRQPDENNNVKTASTAKRFKNEGELLDHANNNLLQALKKDMVAKEGRVNSEKLRKDGYSERIIAKLENA
jgi:hypothetical protein